MASFTERIKVIIDVTADNATRSFQNFKKSIADADTATGKFKAGGSAALSAVTANAGTLALAGGSALVAFGVNAVSAFQETALGAGKLRDSLGVTAEEASRLQEVAGDLGIDVGTLQSTIGRMNRTAEESPDKFDAIGAAIKRNKDGSVDTLETFKNVAEALRNIPDPARRAALAQQVLGRSWQEVSELIMSGSAGITNALADVENSKVIDDEEVAKARRFRDAMDKLKGSLEEVALTAGETLVPLLTDAAEVLHDAQAAAKDADDASGGLLSTFAEYSSGLGIMRGTAELAGDAGRAVFGLFTEEKHRADFASTYTAAQEGINASIADASREFELAETAARDYTDAQDIVEGAIDEAVEAQERQNDELREARDRFRDAADAVYDTQEAEDRFRDSVEDAYLALNTEGTSLQDVRSKLRNAAQAADELAQAKVREKGVTLDSVRGQQVYNQELLNVASTLAGPARTEILNHAARINGIPESKVSQISAAIDAGNIQLAENILNNVSRRRTVPIVPQVITNGAGTRIRVDEGGNVRAFDDGGVVPGPRGSAQLAVVHGGETILPTHKSGGGAAGEVTLNATINVMGDTSPDAVVQALDKWIRRNGPGFLNRRLNNQG